MLVRRDKLVTKEVTAPAGTPPLTRIKPGEDTETGPPAPPTAVSVGALGFDLKAKSKNMLSNNVRKAVAWFMLGVGCVSLLAVAAIAGADLGSTRDLSNMWIGTVGGLTGSGIVLFVLAYLLVMGFGEVEFSVNSGGIKEGPDAEEDGAAGDGQDAGGGAEGDSPPRRRS